MSFSLKKAGAMYQRAMTALFSDMMQEEMEVFMDDVIVKSKAEEDHLADLQYFWTTMKVWLKLNQNKWVFKATSGKLLGFIVARHSNWPGKD